MTHQCGYVSVGRKRLSGTSYKFSKRGSVIRADDPNFLYDIQRRPKRERIRASKDSGLRPTKERVKHLEEQFKPDDSKSGNAVS